MSVLKQAQGFLGNQKPFTAVSDWIDRLCTDRYAEDEYDGIPELVESINLQGTGPQEASRSLRKKLKYSNVHGQKRALTILKALVENCGTRFQSTFANERLVDRIKLMSQDELVDASVRRKLMRVLLSWQIQFKDDPSMRLVASLYVACGGGRKSDAQKRSEAAEAYRREQERLAKERQMRSDAKAAQRLQKEEEKHRKDREKGRRNTSSRPKFNFEQEKPQILSALATSQSSATALVNALQHVNREKESVTVNARVQDYLGRVKTERKKIIRYIQLVQEEEFLGSLISANEQVILALQLYDKLSKPAEHDSDDEEPLANITGDAASRAAARYEADDAEIEAVRKRLAEARMGAPEGELEKLQDKQRVRLERHNSYMSSRSNVNLSGGGAAMRDLMDLNFDEGSSNLPPSLKPSVQSSSTAGRTESNTAGRTGTLSDYSDYDESEDSEAEAEISSSRPRAAAAATAAQSSSSIGGSSFDGTESGGIGWSSHPDYDDDDDLPLSRQPQIGPAHSFVDADEDDPFGDTAGVTNGSPEWGYSGRRQEFAAV